MTTVDGSEIRRSPVEGFVVYPIIYNGFGCTIPGRWCINSCQNSPIGGLHDPGWRLRQGRRHRRGLFWSTGGFLPGKEVGIVYSSRWWFQIFFVFTPTRGNDPIWLMFFRWVETTNYSCLFKDFRRFFSHLNTGLPLLPLLSRKRMMTCNPIFDHRQIGETPSVWMGRQFYDHRKIMYKMKSSLCKVIPSSNR